MLLPLSKATNPTTSNSLLNRATNRAINLPLLLKERTVKEGTARLVSLNRVTVNLSRVMVNLPLRVDTVLLKVSSGFFYTFTASTDPVKRAGYPQQQPGFAPPQPGYGAPPPPQFYAGGGAVHVARTYLGTPIHPAENPLLPPHEKVREGVAVDGYDATKDVETIKKATKVSLRSLRRGKKSLLTFRFSFIGLWCTFS